MSLFQGFDSLMITIIISCFILALFFFLLNVLDYYLYVITVYLFIVGVLFGLLGSFVMFIFGVSTSLIIGGTMLLYRKIKDH